MSDDYNAEEKAECLQLACVHMDGATVVVCYECAEAALREAYDAGDAAGITAERERARPLVEAASNFDEYMRTRYRWAWAWGRGQALYDAIRAYLANTGETES